MLNREKIKDAICNNDIPFLDAVINEHSTEVRLKDDNNETLLLYALSDGNSAAYKYLIERGASLNSINNEGETAVHSVIYSGDPHRLEEILNYKKELIDTSSSDGTTPLILAIGLEAREMAKILILHGANVNISDVQGIMPIHIASQLGFAELVQLLIEKESDLHKKTKNGNLPISLAANNGHDKVVKMLYEKMYKS